MLRPDEVKFGFPQWEIVALLMAYTTATSSTPLTKFNTIALIRSFPQTLQYDHPVTDPIIGAGALDQHI